VDIDAQAVEVCQLSLYLRLLKDETTGTATVLLDFAHNRKNEDAAPRPEQEHRWATRSSARYFGGRLFVSEEERKLNAMDFEDAFSEVMKRGGFDAIVGNRVHKHASA